MLLLELDTIRKGRKFSVLEFEPGNDKKYKVEAIWNNAVYAKEADGYLLGLYYLVAWKGYPEKKNTRERSSAVIHLRKIVSTFHKDHPKKPTTTSALVDSAPPIARPTIKHTDLLKWKQERPIGCTKKYAK